MPSRKKINDFHTERKQINVFWQAGKKSTTKWNKIYAKKEKNQWFFVIVRANISECATNHAFGKDTCQSGKKSMPIRRKIYAQQEKKSKIIMFPRDQLFRDKGKLRCNKSSIVGHIMQTKLYIFVYKQINQNKVPWIESIFEAQNICFGPRIAGLLESFLS